MLMSFSVLIGGTYESTVAEYLLDLFLYEWCGAGSRHALLSPDQPVRQGGGKDPVGSSKEP